jgi:hypothetical protein
VAIDDVRIEELLHPRLLARCAAVYGDGHFREAAQLAMTCVECALRETSGIRGPSAARLIDELLGSDEGLKLRVPFGEELQNDAWKLFRGAFAYYRNFSSHNDSQFDRVTSLRVLILASELLALIGASKISFEEIGGADGLIRRGVFASHANLEDLLAFLDDYTIIDETVDGFYEELHEHGYGDEQLQALFDLGLVRYSHQDVIPSLPDFVEDSHPVESIGQFELTPLGRHILASRDVPLN